jgi:hypothetical protein
VAPRDIASSPDNPAGLVKNCEGTWLVLECYHSLSCEMPGGPWMTSVMCGLKKAASSELSCSRRLYCPLHLLLGRDEQ